jgi:uncharacterized membrane protein
MEGGARVSGHSIHPVLIVFPLGLLSIGVIFDFIHLIGGSPRFTPIAYRMIASGLVAGVMSAVFCWIECFIIASGSRAKKIGLMHTMVNGIVLLLFAGSLYFRYDDPLRPEIMATVFSTVGALFALLGALIGGELVETLNDEIHTRAHRDAPMFLSVTHVTNDQLSRGTTASVRR